MAVLIAEVLFALFAVFGVYATVRLIATTFFCPSSYGVSLEIKENVDVAEAKRRFFRAKDMAWGAGRVVVLIEGGLQNAALIYDCLASFGADCYLVAGEKSTKEKEG